MCLKPWLNVILDPREGGVNSDVPRVGPSGVVIFAVEKKAKVERESQYGERLILQNLFENWRAEDWLSRCTWSIGLDIYPLAGKQRPSIRTASLLEVSWCCERKHPNMH